MKFTYFLCVLPSNFLLLSHDLTSYFIIISHSYMLSCINTLCTPPGIIFQPSCCTPSVCAFTGRSICSFISPSVSQSQSAFQSSICSLLHSVIHSIFFICFLVHWFIYLLTHSLIPLVVCLFFPEYFIVMKCLNPLNPMSDQYRISPYNVNTK